MEAALALYSHQYVKYNPALLNEASCLKSDDDPKFWMVRANADKARSPAIDLLNSRCKTSFEVMILMNVSLPLLEFFFIKTVCFFAAAYRNLGQNLWGPHRYGCLSGIQVRTVVSGPCAAHSLLITTEGKLWSWGE